MFSLHVTTRAFGTLSPVHFFVINKPINMSIERMPDLANGLADCVGQLLQRRVLRRKTGDPKSRRNTTAAKSARVRRKIAADERKTNGTNKRVYKYRTCDRCAFGEKMNT